MFQVGLTCLWDSFWEWIDWLIAGCLYSAILHSQANWLCWHMVLHEWLAFCSVFLNSHRSGVLTAKYWCHMKLLPLAQVLCTSYKYNYAPCACLAVTCHLHFWQNDRDLLRATAVTWGWNGYRNKSQHRKLTLEKKILLLFLQGFRPATFQSQVQHSTELSPPPIAPSAPIGWQGKGLWTP